MSPNKVDYHSRSWSWSALSTEVLLLCLLLQQVTLCRSWDLYSGIKFCRRKVITNALGGHNDAQRQTSIFPREQQHRHRHQEGETIQNNSRRRILFDSMRVAAVFLAPTLAWQLPRAAYASDGDGTGGIVIVRLDSPKDSLGVEIYDTTLRGTNVVAIRRIVVPNKNNRFLREGMILRTKESGGSNSDYTSRELVERLRSGPYPLEIGFQNLAAGGDAISDLGTSIVTPKDALDLAQKTETPSAGGNSGKARGVEYSITTTQQKPPSECAIKSRRNDVLEIEYEASYVADENAKKVIYDASAFRGTGNRPYQMVLGSGDMIPGVDQGLYDMCPGEQRVLKIPPVLGHGPNSRRLYRIPDKYVNLEWKVGLVTIDSTIREDNNVVSRDERESRFAY
ncbi:unnamed protein product [Pseudo-nitzschia multistriata]|uniref:peptidylprolyl isomerase n=1 Tax=Pseudo-nitzschia multistriata TaxID=183589 RepID=A0A448Z4L2_9STRA|nr:unnamed protein product [Pseudo-nitzschia multistriata]